MDPLSQIVQAGIVRPEGGLPDKGGLAGLKTGDVLAALVLEATDTGEVLLSLKGEKIAARTETTLLPGDRVSLRVEDLAGTVVLKLVAKEAPDARQVGELIRGRIPQSMNVGGDYSELRTALRELLQKSPSLRDGSLGALLGRLEQLLPDKEVSPGRLKAFVENSGIFYERKLAASIGHEEKGGPAADLKALILQSQASGREAAERNTALRDEVDKFLDISERVLKNTEIVQLANSLINRTEGTFWAAIPYGDSLHSESVDWEVHRGDGEGESEGISFSLSFDLSGLGKVKVDGLFSDNRLHCSFWGRDEEAAQFMGNHLEEFSRSIGLKGMDVGNLACGVTRGAEESPLQRSMKSAGIRLVDRQA